MPRSSAGHHAATKIQAVVRKNNTVTLLVHRAATRIQCRCRMKLGARRFHKTCHMVVAELRGKCKDLELQLKEAQDAMRIEKITRRAMLNDCFHDRRGSNDNWWGTIRDRWGGGMNPWWNPHLTREEILELPPYPPAPGTVRTSWGATLTPGRGGYGGDREPPAHGRQLRIGKMHPGDLGWASTCDGKGTSEKIIGPTFGAYPHLLN